MNLISHDKLHTVCILFRFSRLNSAFKFNKNLAIANRSRVSCAHNSLVEGIYDNPVTLKSRLTVKITGNGTIEYIIYTTYY